MSFASTLALHCSKRRQISRWSQRAAKCSGVAWLEKSANINSKHENYENKRGTTSEGVVGEGHLQYALLVDAICSSNQMAYHGSAVSNSCRFTNAPCNAGGSGSLQTRMNAAARLIQPLQRRRTHFKINQCFLQQASYTQSSRKHWHNKRSAQHSTARRCSRTCTLLTRPRVTRSIINAAQPLERPVVLYITCTPAGAAASRWHANTTQGKMRRTR